jgi:hypothetical protein
VNLTKIMLLRSKTMKKIMSILLIGVILTLSGCRDTYHLLGTWRSVENNNSVTFTFRENGTGVGVVRVEGESRERRTFTWESENGRVTIRYDDDNSTETISYTVTDDTLTMSSGWHRIEFTKQNSPLPFIIVGLIVVGVSSVLVVLYKRRQSTQVANISPRPISERGDTSWTCSVCNKKHHDYSAVCPCKGQKQD